jgi:hypothetical protein
MRQPFDFPHLDPSQDLSELYGSAFDLLCDLWARLRAFQSSCLEEEFLVQLISCLENQVMAAGVLLAIKVDLLSGR